jgi:hypothetical protein
MIHNHEAVGSIPPLATKRKAKYINAFRYFCWTN